LFADDQGYRSQLHGLEPKTKEDSEFFNAARQASNKAFFARVNINSIFAPRIVSMCDVKKEETPTVRIVTFREDGGMEKYKFEGAIEKKEIIEFLKQYFNGNLKPSYKSQELRVDNSKAVKTLVGNNFNDIVYDESKNVLVYFHKPDCQICAKMTFRFERVAKRFAGISDIVFAQIDVENNDPGGIPVRKIPFFRWFQKNNKYTEIAMDLVNEDEMVEFVETQIINDGGEL